MQSQFEFGNTIWRLPYFLMYLFMVKIYTCNHVITDTRINSSEFTSFEYLAQRSARILPVYVPMTLISVLCDCPCEAFAYIILSSSVAWEQNRTHSLSFTGLKSVTSCLYLPVSASLLPFHLVSWTGAVPVLYLYIIIFIFRLIWAHSKQ
jgi:hypothetical protein